MSYSKRDSLLCVWWQKPWLFICPTCIHVALGVFEEPWVFPKSTSSLEHRLLRVVRECKNMVLYFSLPKPNHLFCLMVRRLPNVIWNFANGHGKGEMDDVRALFKHMVWKEQLKIRGEKLHNTIEMVDFLKVESNKYHVPTLGPNHI